MKWGVHMMILAYPRVTLETCLQVLREGGVRYVEIGHPTFLEKLENGPEWFRETLDSYGIEPIQMHSPSLRLAKFNESEQAVKGVSEMIELAGWLGVDSLIVHPVTFDLSWEAFSRYVYKVRKANVCCFRELAKKAEDLGVVIAVENMLGRSYGSTPSDLLDLLDEVGSNSLGVCLDTGHANVNGFPPHEFLIRIRERLVATHLHDNDGHSDLHLPPLMGNIDWKSFLAELKDTGYSRPIIYEIANAKGLDEGKNKLRLLSLISEKLGSDVATGTRL